MPFCLRVTIETITGWKYRNCADHFENSLVVFGLGNAIRDELFTFKWLMKKCIVLATPTCVRLTAPSSHTVRQQPQSTHLPKSILKTPSRVGRMQATGHLAAQSPQPAHFSLEITGRCRSIVRLARLLAQSYGDLQWRFDHSGSQTCAREFTASIHFSSNNRQYYAFLDFALSCCLTSSGFLGFSLDTSPGSRS